MDADHFENYQKFVKFQNKNVFYRDGQLVWVLGYTGKTVLFKNDAFYSHVSGKFLSYPSHVMLADRHGNKWSVPIYEV